MFQESFQIYYKIESLHYESPPGTNCVQLLKMIVISTRCDLRAPATTRVFNLVRRFPADRGRDVRDSQTRQSEPRQDGALSLVQIHRDTALSLVEIRVLLCQLSYTIKTQLKAPKVPYFGHFLPFAVSLWYKDRW